MPLPYWLRLLCLSLAAGAGVYAATAAAVAAAAPWARKRAEHAAPDLAANALFFLRVAPLLCALAAVAALCLPSYLWLEPSGREQVGFGLLLAALAGASLAVVASARMARAAWSTAVFLRACRRRGRAQPHAGQDLLLLPPPAPSLALAGFFRARVLVSERAWLGLSPAQLEAGLAHERAHFRARDNWRRLLLLAVPLPGRRSEEIARAWSRCSEYAADDRAVAGCPDRSLTLASALLAVANLGVAAPAPAALSFLLPPVRSGRELAARIERLLQPPAPAPHQRSGRIAWLLAGSVALMALMLQPATLMAAHRVLEHLAR